MVLWNQLVLQGLTGQQVSDVIVSVDRMEKGNHPICSARHEIEKAYGVKIHTIVTVQDIVRALENGIIGGTEHLKAMKNYMESYGGNTYGN